MNMQTGPAPKQSLDNWLIWTGVIEIINIPIFSFLWWSLNLMLPGDEDVLSLAGLATLGVILLEGGLYWLLVRARFFQRTPARFRLFLLQGVYLANILLLLVFPAILILRLLAGQPVEVGDFLLGAGYYLFGFGEFLHYFIFKINMRPYELRLALQKRQFVPARLMRELRRARNEHLKSNQV